MSAPPATVTTAPSDGVRGFARRHPITLYLMIVFGLGYPLMLLPVAASKGIIPGASLPARVGLDFERSAALLMVVLALFPAALIVSALEGGRSTVAALLRRMVAWRADAASWVIILLALPVGTVAIALLMGDRFQPPTLSALAAELGGFLAGFLAVNLWEEASWAGFMQTRLEQRHGLYRAALLTAIPFAGIHMPLQLLNGSPTLGQLLASFVMLVVLAAVVRSYFGLVMGRTGGSLFAVGVAHTIFNRSNNSDGIAAKLLGGEHRQLAALLATLLLTVALGLWHRRHRPTPATQDQRSG